MSSENGDIKIILDRSAFALWHREIDRESLPIKINNGTEIVAPTIAERDGYLPNSFIPKQTWRDLTATENLQSIFSWEAIDRWELGQYIGAIEIPDRLIAPLRQDIETKDRSNYNSVILTANDLDTVAAISNHLQSYLLVDEEITALGLQRHPPGLITSTIDAIRYLPQLPRVGLHLDSWQKYPLRRRHLSSNRICINIGLETRYFLFIDLSLMKMAQMLGINSSIEISHYYRGIEIPDLFMAAFPNYPVLKLGLPPNFAYIAPTENIIHDASSLDKDKLDFSLTYIGKFGIVPNQV
jgi:hypothetical protein